MLIIFCKIALLLKYNLSAPELADDYLTTRLTPDNYNFIRQSNNFRQTYML